VDWTAAFVSLGVGLGLAAATGLRVFLPLLVLGAAANAGWVPLSEGFAWLAAWPTLIALATATALEVAAYYVPWLDNLLDLAAAPLAVLAGVIAMAAVVTDLPPFLRWSIAIIAGGGAAGLVQGLTSFTRLKSTATTGGAANPILATMELVGALATSFIAIFAPLMAIGVLVAMVWVVRRIARRARGQNHVTGSKLQATK
jgi:hypothetical protein